MSIMYRLIHTVWIFIFLIAFRLSAQRDDYTLYLQSGTYCLPVSDTIPELEAGPGGLSFLVAQFWKIPSADEVRNMERSGLMLRQYLSGNAYLAVLRHPADLTTHTKKLRSISPIKPEFKTTASLLNNDIPGWTMQQDGRVNMSLLYFKEDVSRQNIVEVFVKMGAGLKSLDETYGVIHVLIDPVQLPEILKLPFIYWVEFVDASSLPELYSANPAMRCNTIKQRFPGGINFDGKGVVIALGDDGKAGPHIDFEGRLDQSHVVGSAGDKGHSDFMAGIIAGAGNLNPKMEGIAPGADIIMFKNLPPEDEIYWEAVNTAATTYANNKMRITSTSYSNGCNSGYTSFAVKADQQIRQMPSLMHVFSAGNSGNSYCGLSGLTGWYTITGGIKMSKNAIVVGEVDADGNLSDYSSRGPATDGRIKPDICGVGSGIYAAQPDNTYDNTLGTSAACASVTGMLAQLYDAYKQKNGGQDPNSALIKAVLLNTAEDLGNPGPDFKHGWGMPNLLRAYRTIDYGRYFSGTLSNTQKNTHSIFVPSTAKQVRVMLYWCDPEAVPAAKKALFNDLDMKVSSPSSAVVLPWILNHKANASTLDMPAVRGVDTLNNIEQVTIDNPESGNYQIEIAASKVPLGQQDYFLVYEIVYDEITVTYPIGGESFVPGETEVIRWDDGGSGNYMIELSTDAGLNWDTVVSGLPASQKSYSWVVPYQLTGDGRIKVSRLGMTDESDVSFSILGVPDSLQIEWSCDSSAKLKWTEAAGAVSYEVSMLGQRNMDSVTTVSSNYYVFNGLDKNKEYWFSVAALSPSGIKGRRAIAVKKNPGIFSCPPLVDASIIEAGPSEGIVPDCQGAASMMVSMIVENAGSGNIENIPVLYSVNGVVKDSQVIANFLKPGQGRFFFFPVTADLSLPGIYKIDVEVKLPGDAVASNNKKTIMVEVVKGELKQVPWTEAFDNFQECKIIGGTPSSNCTKACDLYYGWWNEENGKVDMVDWRPLSGKTTSSGTGPEGDHTNGITGKYLYIESTSCFNKTAQLISPCVNIPDTAVNPVLGFWYNMYGSTMGELHVYVMADGMWSRDMTIPITGNQGRVWKKEEIVLDRYIGKVVNIKFEGITGNGGTSDIAIDDISITDQPENPEGWSDVAKNKSVLFYPNPSTELLHYKLYSDAWKTVELYDLQGKMVFSYPIVSGNGSMDISSISPGVYLLQVVSKSDKANYKLVKLK